MPNDRVVVQEQLHLSLTNFENQLDIFEQTVVVDDPSRPPPKGHEDEKASLKIKTVSANVFCLTGTNVYQVKGDEKDLAIKSRQYLRL